MNGCLYCGHTDLRPWRKDCRDCFMGLPLVVSYARCANCGSAQQSPIPSDTAALYADYPIHRPRSKAYNRLRSFLFSEVYFDASGLGAEQRLLDYGCGDGWYLKSLGAQHQHVYGYEYSAPHARELARSLALPVTASLDELKALEPQGFDVITLHFVFEHVTDPAPLLARLAGCLRPGGRIFIVIPEAESWESRLFGVLWHGLDPPRHISFATNQGMQLAAKSAGLTVAAKKPLAFPNTFAGSLATLPGGTFHPMLFNLLLPLGLLVAHLRPGGSVAYTLTRSS